MNWFHYVNLTDAEGEYFWPGEDYQIVNKWDGGTLIQWTAPDAGDYYVKIESGCQRLGHRHLHPDHHSPVGEAPQADYKVVLIDILPRGRTKCQSRLL